MCLIRLENVSKIYSSGEEKVAAVSNLSLEVESGEFVAVTGPSGCGKSTLLHMIGGLSRPSSGGISVRGKSLYQRTQSGLALYRRRYVGIVYQFYNLVPELTARENLILPALMDGRRVEEEWVDEIFEILGIEEKKDAYPVQLSAGQQQKIAVGRALVNRPPLLLADEPTSMVDACSRATILDMLLNLRDEVGMTVIFITHDIGLAYYISDTVYIMEHGKFVEYGKADEVILAPKAAYTKRLISDVPKIHEEWDLSTVDLLTEAQ